MTGIETLTRPADILTDEARAELTKLSPRPGDMIAITMPSGVPVEYYQTAREILRRAMAAAGIDGVSVLVIPAGYGLAMMDDAWLAERGLMRVQPGSITRAGDTSILKNWQF